VASRRRFVGVKSIITAAAESLQQLVTNTSSSIYSYSTIVYVQVGHDDILRTSVYELQPWHCLYTCE
jgi:hypothetical protein